jgi:hypothetical protein
VSRGDTFRQREVLATMPGTIRTEHDLHQRFATARHNGEWFRKSPNFSPSLTRSPATRWRHYHAPSLAVAVSTYAAPWPFEARGRNISRHFGVEVR